LLDTNSAAAAADASQRPGMQTPYPHVALRRAVSVHARNSGVRIFAPKARRQRHRVICAYCT